MPGQRPGALLRRLAGGRRVRQVALHDCPARLACLAGALERREPWGVWGGEWFVQGVVVPRKRPRGRPRKTEVAA